MNEIPPNCAILGFGGNVGTEDEIRTRFVHARAAFQQYGHVSSASLYRTKAMGPAQSDFLNTAINVRIEDGTPQELIAFALEIEMLLGRDRGVETRWGPRKIDIDVLVWGARAMRTETIELPHPRLLERRFALEPLSELIGPLEMPGTGQPIWKLRDRVTDQQIELIAASW